MAQVIEGLPRKHEVLSSNPSTIKQQQQKRKLMRIKLNLIPPPITSMNYYFILE
jgi:hypothetical protein